MKKSGQILVEDYIKAANEAVMKGGLPPCYLRFGKSIEEQRILYSGLQDKGCIKQRLYNKEGRNVFVWFPIDLEDKFRLAVWRAKNRG